MFGKKHITHFHVCVTYIYTSTQHYIDPISNCMYDKTNVSRLHKNSIRTATIQWWQRQWHYTMATNQPRKCKMYVDGDCKIEILRATMLIHHLLFIHCCKEVSFYQYYIVPSHSHCQCAIPFAKWFVFCFFFSSVQSLFSCCHCLPVILLYHWATLDFVCLQNFALSPLLVDVCLRCCLFVFVFYFSLFSLNQKNVWSNLVF